jgi:predicted NAD-dependent protein-ADP-ribosyltransferase YbiA (DUF1768 family)
MVKSILDSTIEYKEARDIDSDDIDFDANLYETTLFNTPVVFALGKPKYTYIDKNIVYYPIYLVVNDEIKMQLGLYEILANTQEEIVDTEGDIDLNKFSKPVLYTFAAEELVPKATAPAKPKAKSKRSSTWIQKFMNNDDFGIIDTPYDGNCFFSMIKLALEENGNENNSSVEDMRELLAANATEDVFRQYKMLYDELKTNEANLMYEIKNVTSRLTSLKQKIKTSKDRNLQQSYIKQAEEMKNVYERLKNDITNMKEMKTEFEFMNGIENLPMLKLKIKTRDYWADTWAISTLERELNIKIIIFSELNYLEGDELNVLQCGQLNDKVLEERGIFEPSFYVLACYHGGNHYQLITYKSQKSFDFGELPETVKTLVKDKCLEKLAGPYSLIPDFVKEATSAEASATVVKEPDLSSDLYSNGTVFRFYSKSADKPQPGKGEGETLGSEGDAAYLELSQIPQWRKKLSNFWPAEFKLDGHRWLSVEHYYQASKYKKSNKDFYIQFSLDTKDSAIAKDAVLAKAAGGKSGKFKGELVRPKNTLMDKDFFSVQQGSKYTRAEQEMESAMRAKFTQNADLKALLIATGRAKLEHVSRGKPAIVFNELMRVRRELTHV